MKKHIVAINQMPLENIDVNHTTSYILKNYLEYYNLTATITDWNFKLMELQNMFIWGSNSNIQNDDDNNMLLYYNYLALKNMDDKACVNIKARLMSLKPNHITSEVAYYDKHMKLFAQKLEEVITEYINEIYSDEIICFFFFIDSKYKWICASIIAEIIKQQHSESIIVVGGIEDDNSAIEYLRIFNQFDFAIWGEVENATLDLCKCLTEEKKAYRDIPHLVFRHENTVNASACEEEYYASLAEPSLRPDYSSLFEEIKSNNINRTYSSVLSIELSRQDRLKPVQSVIDEILYFINEHHTYAFHFNAYELTDNNQVQFYQLLDELILIKEKFPDFSISLFPVVARNISPTVLRKMMMVGFYSIQIEYISDSENILKKHEAKSTFADNLLLIKYASLYNIIQTEADVLMGIPGETDDDILQGISN